MMILANKESTGVMSNVRCESSFTSHVSRKRRHYLL